MNPRRDQVMRLFGAKPLLIEAAKLEAAYPARRPYALREAVAVIDIAGVLANEPSLSEALFLGATAYGQILDEAEQAAADPEVRGILLRVHSPGDDSDNAFETAAALAEIDHRKPLWAVADNSMFSAAYLLATSAARIYVPPYTGGVGSIGVYAEHVEWSEYNRKLGVKVTYIAEGEGKTDGNPYEPLSDSARTALEGEISRLYGLFVGRVAAGLADRTGGYREALADLIAHTRRHEISNQGGNMQEETARVESPEPIIDMEALRAEAARQGYAQAREVVELCALAGMPGRAAALLARQAVPAEARQYLLEARAAEQPAEIRSHVMPDAGTTTSNPVVQAVERLAAAVKGGK